MSTDKLTSHNACPSYRYRFRDANELLSFLGKLQGCVKVSLVEKMRDTERYIAGLKLVKEFREGGLPTLTEEQLREIAWAIERMEHEDAKEANKVPSATV